MTPRWSIEKIIDKLLLPSSSILFLQIGQEGEDTMKNLRTSFAGLFGNDLKWLLFYFWNNY